MGVNQPSGPSSAIRDPREREVLPTPGTIANTSLTAIGTRGDGQPNHYCKNSKVECPDFGEKM